MIPQKDLSVLQFLNFVGQMTRDNGLEIFRNQLPLTGERGLGHGGGVGLQGELGVVVVEVLDLDSDGGAAAEPRLRLLLRGHHHQQELPLVWVLIIQFLGK